MKIFLKQLLPCRYVPTKCTVCNKNKNLAITVHQPSKPVVGNKEFVWREMLSGCCPIDGYRYLAQTFRNQKKGNRNRKRGIIKKKKTLSLRKRERERERERKREREREW